MQKLALLRPHLELDPPIDDLRPQTDRERERESERERAREEKERERERKREKERQGEGERDTPEEKMRVKAGDLLAPGFAPRKLWWQLTPLEGSMATSRQTAANNSQQHQSQEQSLQGWLNTDVCGVLSPQLSGLFLLQARKLAFLHASKATGRQSSIVAVLVWSNLPVGFPPSLIEANEVYRWQEASAPCE